MIRRFRASLFGLALLSCAPAPEQLLTRCADLAKTEALEEARVACEKALQANPKSGDPHYWLGMLHLRQGDGSTAIDDFARGYALSPANPAIRSAYADALLLAVEANPSLPPVRETLERLITATLTQDPRSFDGLRWRGRFSFALGDLPAAADSLAAAHQLRPRDAATALAYARALNRQNQSPAAITLLRQQLEFNTRFPAIYDLLSDTLLATGDAAAAEVILRQKTSRLPEPTHFIQLARFYHDRGNLPARDATLSATAALSSRPNRYLALSEFHESIGDRSTALSLARTGLAQPNADTAAHHRRIIQLLLRLARPEEALAAADTALTARPKDPEMRALRAGLLLDSNRAAEAEASLRDLVRDRPRDAVLRQNLGRSLFAQRKFPAAREAFQTAASLRADFLEPRLALAEISLLEQKASDALRWADAALAINPQFPPARLQRIAALTSLGQTTTARNELNPLLAAEPNSPDLRLQSGLLLLAEQRPAAAEPIFRSLLSSRGAADQRALLGLAEALVSLKQATAALTLLEQSLASSPADLNLLSALARIAARSQAAARALPLFEKAKANDPRPEILALEANLRASSGDLSSALQLLDQALSRDAKNPTLLSQHAFLAYRSGQTALALSRFRQAFALSPEDPDLMNNIASILVEAPSPSSAALAEALNLAQRAARLAPANPAYADTLALVYLASNQADSALAIFARNAATSPNLPTFRYHHGLALARLGRSREARAEFTAALALNPAAADAALIRAALDRLQAPH